MRTPVTVATVGFGARVSRVAGVLDDLPQAELRWLCEPSLELQLLLKRRFPGARVTGDFDALLEDESLDAIFLAGLPGRFTLVRRALEADKHVLVEAPLAAETTQADRLVELARTKGRQLRTSHPLVFRPALRKLRELIEFDRLGDIYYVIAARHDVGESNGGDANIVWKLGGEEVATLLYLLGDEPVDAAARGEAYVREGVADVAFCHLAFATGIAVHLHLSWLDRRPMRRIAVIGSKRMAVFDALEAGRALTLHHGAVLPRTPDRSGDGIHVRPADVVAVYEPPADPLRLECEAFIGAIQAPVDSAPAHRATAVVGTLEALDRSLADGGATYPLNVPRGERARAGAAPRPGEPKKREDASRSIGGGSPLGRR